MARFTLPRDLYHGKGALEALKTFEGKRAMVCVGGGSMKRFGFLDRAVDYLKEAGMEVQLFEGIESDPSVETVMRGAKAMEEFQPDWIVAMGGGSPIDAAKAMWIKYEYPDITFEEMCKVFGMPKLRKKAHFCAISSTSGTATEVTAFAVITDYEKGIKYPLADFEITPDVAIVDPDLAETMPQKLVAHTGMDAMTHAIEAYVSTANCDFTDPLALYAIRMIQADLVDSYNGDMAKRDSREMQRLSIVRALLLEPKLLIADEPTTALDVTIQAQVLDLMNNLKEKFKTAMILITHDLGVVAQVCDKVAIMYAGEIVESGSLEEIFENTKHPYTLGLFGSIPSLDEERSRLTPIQGLMPDPTILPKGCKFNPRCPHATDLCRKKIPNAVEVIPGHKVKCFIAEGLVEFKEDWEAKDGE